jgi:Ca2+/Na+ antiporter
MDGRLLSASVLALIALILLLIARRLRQSRTQKTIILAACGLLIVAAIISFITLFN